MGQQGAFDLAQFDSVTAYLDLKVQATQMLQVAVATPAAAIAGAIQQRRRTAFFDLRCHGERIGDETLGGLFRPMQITQADAVAADADFARYAARANGAVTVQNPDLRVGDWPPDMHVR